MFKYKLVASWCPTRKYWFNRRRIKHKTPIALRKLSISSSGGNVSQSYTTGYVSTNTGNRRCFHLSVMVKADECSYLNIKIENGTDSLSCYFNLTNATTGSNDSNSNYLEYTYK